MIHSDIQVIFLAFSPRCKIKLYLLHPLVGEESASWGHLSTLIWKKAQIPDSRIKFFATSNDQVTPPPRSFKPLRQHFTKISATIPTHSAQEHIIIDFICWQNIKIACNLPALSICHGSSMFFSKADILSTMVASHLQRKRSAFPGNISLNLLLIWKLVKTAGQDVRDVPS